MVLLATIFPCVQILLAATSISCAVLLIRLNKKATTPITTKPITKEIIQIVAIGPIILLLRNDKKINATFFK